MGTVKKTGNPKTNIKFLELLNLIYLLFEIILDEDMLPNFLDDFEVPSVEVESDSELTSEYSDINSEPDEDSKGEITPANMEENNTSEEEFISDTEAICDSYTSSENSNISEIK